MKDCMELEKYTNKNGYNGTISRRITVTYTVSIHVITDKNKSTAMMYKFHIKMLNTATTIAHIPKRKTCKNLNYI